MIYRQVCGCFVVRGVMHPDQDLRLLCCRNGAVLELVPGDMCDGDREATPDEVSAILRTHRRIKNSASEYADLQKVARRLFGT